MNCLQSSYGDGYGSILSFIRRTLIMLVCLIHMLARSEWFSKFSDEGWLAEPREKVIQHQSGVGGIWWDQEINSCESWTVASQRVYTRHQNLVFMVMDIICLKNCTSGPTRYCSLIVCKVGSVLLRKTHAVDARHVLENALLKCSLKRIPFLGFKQVPVAKITDMGVTRWSGMGLWVAGLIKKSCVIRSHTQ